MKGIILAGGTGSRLYPATKAISKQLVPVYNKPMIYYSMSILMLADITEILIISDPHHIESYKKLFGDGSWLGISIEYALQEEPNGIGEAFIIGEEFIGQDNVCLILGDNILFGWQLSEMLISAKHAVENTKDSMIFGYNINNPVEFGVAEIDDKLNVLSLEEKPKIPKSNWAVIGLYMYDNSVVDVAKLIRPSDRGELEITDINKHYLKNKKLKIQLFGRGCTWFDAGNCDDLYDASSFVRTIERNQGFKIACLEEIALSKRLISRDRLSSMIKQGAPSKYGQYLLGLVEE